MRTFKAMHDIRFIRDNPDTFDAAMMRRGIAPIARELLALDAKRRHIQAKLQAQQSRRNEVSKEIGKVKGAGGDADALMAEVAELKQSMPTLEAEDTKLEQELNSQLMGMPNILEELVPDGADENDNELLRVVGIPPSFTFTPRDHVELGEALGQMDFNRAAKLSGARETLPPALVRTQTMTGTGQLPKFEDDLFRTTDDRWLIPTAEVPLTNLVADSIIPHSQLPMRMTAYTPCFRAEAGSAGRDTRGMIRQHQFSKVELVSIVAPDEADAELERMTQCAEAILQRLGLSYRVLRLCTGDTGFSARQTLDIEVWLPGQDDGKGMFREISSCSNCGPFQARRMKARTKADGEKETEFVHTLNGSALAVGRCMIAILENGQCEDGSIILPEPLHSYMGTDKLIALS